MKYLRSTEPSLVCISCCFVDASFLSRDIVVSFPEDHADTVRFVDAFTSPKRPADFVSGFPNNVLAAINVEIQGDVCPNFHSFTIKYEGDQVLPYMDMLNAVAKIANYHNLESKFDESVSSRLPARVPAMLRTAVQHYLGHLDSGHASILRYAGKRMTCMTVCSAKIDSVTIKAVANDKAVEADGIQGLYKFMTSTIRSMCNAIEHFQHETAVFFPTTGHDYYELGDYLVGAILVLAPILLLGFLELFCVWRETPSRLSIFRRAAAAVMLYFRIVCVTVVAFSGMKAVLGRLPPSLQSSSLFVAMDLILILSVRKYVARVRMARFLSGVIIFSAALVTTFTAMGSGMVLYTLCMMSYTMSLVNEQLSRNRTLVEGAILPLCSVVLLLKGLLAATNRDAVENMANLLSNRLVLLVLYPATLMLHANEPPKSMDIDIKH